MNEVNLNRYAISRAVWQRIFENAEMLTGHRDMILSEAKELDRLRAKAEYNTGSISAASVWTLVATAYYFAPETIAEVGTFIGRSAYAMSEGCLAADSGAVIYTCDASNAIDLTGQRQFQHGTELVQFQKANSTEMFQKIADDGVTIDWVHLDGRLIESDIPLLNKITHDRTLFTLDDVEGTEKGVINLLRLMSALGNLTHLVVYPPERDLLQHFGLRDSCTTAMVLPRTLFKLTAQ